MIYTKSQQDSIIYQSQVWMADMGVKLEALERAMQPCDELYCQNYKVRVFIAALQKDTDLKDFEKEAIYTCMVNTTGIKDYPVFTPIIGIAPPAIIIGGQGPPGPSGADGKEGTDAFIDCISEDDGITIETRDVAGVKTFVWTHTPYIEPTISLSINPSAVTEIGNVLDITLSMVLTKGRDDVTASVITSDPTLDTAYQAILDLPGLNAGGSPNRSLVASGVIATTTYAVNISDEDPAVVKSTSSKTITLVYPFFDGSGTSATVNPYSSLTKRIVTKSNKSVAFNGTDEYFWFCYPASYGDLDNIKDQNGFNVTGSFTKTVVDVQSTGLVNNWLISYNFYRTTSTTDINGTFTFNF